MILLFEGIKDDSGIHEGFRGIVKALNEPSDAYQLNTANKLYSQQSYRILDEYLTVLKDKYLTEIKPVDFVSNRENVRQGKIRTAS